MILHLTRSSRLWIFQQLGFQMFQVRLQKKATSTLLTNFPGFSSIKKLRKDL
jgi:hypothetical protein